MGLCCKNKKVFAPITKYLCYIENYYSLRKESSNAKTLPDFRLAEMIGKLRNELKQLDTLQAILSCTRGGGGGLRNTVNQTLAVSSSIPLEKRKSSGEKSYQVQVIHWTRENSLGEVHFLFMRDLTYIHLVVHMSVLEIYLNKDSETLFLLEHRSRHSNKVLQCKGPVFL